jgi:tetratricopeptide (TPR) repeat protein
VSLQDSAGTRPLLPGGIDPLQLIPARDFDRLVVVLTHAERAWVFCLYNTAIVRDAIVEALRARLDPLPVYEFTLSAERPNPRAYLSQLPAGMAARQAVICFYNAWRAFEAGFFGYLDLQREQFWKAPHSLVFWVREADRVAIARRAPNFFSRHAGVFDFQISIPEQWSGGEAAMPATWDSIKERDRQERLYAGLLAEYEADREPDQSVIADLLGKLANIWYYSDRFEQAETALQRRLAIVRELKDQRNEAATLLALGQIRVLRDDRDTALQLYDQALTLFRAMGDRLGEANVLQAQGDAALGAGATAEGMALLDAARTLYDALGVRVGLVNVY